ncbi:hypothetical protein [Paenibacillus sp. Soil724D2]|nr:hypothetical protein [Paenibacillus sp. Soil724D2]
MKDAFFCIYIFWVTERFHLLQVVKGLISVLELFIVADENSADIGAACGL